MMDVSDIILAEAQQYLQTISAGATPTVFPGSSYVGVQECQHICARVCGSAKEPLEMETIPKYTALLLSGLANANSVEIAFSTARALFHVLSSPGASAMGCHSFSIFQAIHLAVSKRVASLLSGKSVTRSQQARDATEKDSDSDANSDADVDIDIDFDIQHSKRRSARRRIADDSSSCSKTVFKAFSQSLQSTVEVLNAIKDDELLSSFVDLLVQMTYVTVVHEDLQGAQTALYDAISSLAVLSSRCLLNVHRACIPLLTLNIPRHMCIPDSQKIRKQCHLTTVELLRNVLKLTLLTHIEAAPSLTSTDDDAPVPNKCSNDLSSTQDDDENEDLSVLQPMGDISSNARKGSSKRRDSTRLSFSSIALVESMDQAGASSAKPPLVHVCAMATFQRMLLTCPDRAPMRAMICESIVRLLSEIYAVQSHSGQKQSVKDLSDSILAHFVQFVKKLCTSSKIGHRAMSLDMLTLLLTQSWLWVVPPHSSSSSLSRQISNKKQMSTHLLHALLNRCEDQSASVRLRALSAWQELLEQYSYDTARDPLMIAVYELLLGISSFEGNASSQLSLLDVLRTMTGDEKPIVRGKAVHVFALALTVPWYSCSPSTPSTMRRITLHIAEEDLLVLSSACSDASVAVRKQASQALYSVLDSQPSHERARWHWLQSALSLTVDGESSVAHKAAQQVHQLILERLFKFQNTMTDGIENEMNPDSQADCLLGWVLIEQIQALDLTQFLGAALINLLQNSHFTFDRKHKTSTSFFYLLHICQQACCLSLDNNHWNSQQSHTIVSAAWILLENIVSHSQLLVMDANKSQQRKLEVFLQQVDSVDFVVRCFKTNHPHCGTQEVMDPLSGRDVQMFKVLDKTIQNLSIEDIRYMTRMVDYQLHSLRCSSEAIAVSISLRAQLSRVLLIHQQQHRADIEGALREDVQLWASHLTMRAYLSLHSFIFQKLPVQTDAWTRSLSPLSKPTGSVQSANLFGSHFQLLPSELQSFFKTASVEAEKQCVDIIQNALFTLGELALLGFQLDEPEINKFNKRKSLFSDCGLLDVVSSKRIMQQSQADVGHATGNLCRFRVMMPTCVVDLIKMLMNTSLPCLSREYFESIGHYSPSKNDITSQYDRPNAIPIRAVSFLTMGKLCLRDIVLARDNVNLFLREINEKHHSKRLSTDERNSMNQSSLHVTRLSLLSSSSPISHLMETEEQELDYRQSRDNLLKNYSVRCNALLVLGDLCIRHTHLVDRHIDSLSYCLQDCDRNVRKNALVLLTQLLMQDYVKWKGLLLYLFLMLINDSDAEIAALAQDILERTLSAKYPGLLQNHISEAFLIFNKCSEHSIFSTMVTHTGADMDFPQVNNVNSDKFVDGTDVLESMVSRLSSANLTRRNRFEIYEFMAKDLSDEMKIQVTAKLVNDILSAAVDNCKQLLPNRSQGGIGMPSARKKRSTFGSHCGSSDHSLALSPFETAIEDVFIFLRSPILKIGSKKSTVGVDAADNTEELQETNSSQGGAHLAFQAAKTKILKTLSSQHLVSHVLPVVMSLKHCLESTKSPLQATLMEYILSLIKNHKVEVDQVLLSDPTLKAEVEYDLRMFEKQKRDMLLSQQQQNQDVSVSTSKPSLVSTASKSSVFLRISDAEITPYIAPGLLSSAIKKPELKSSGNKKRTRADSECSEPSSSSMSAVERHKSIVRSASKLVKSTVQVSASKKIQEHDDSWQRLVTLSDAALDAGDDQLVFDDTKDVVDSAAAPAPATRRKSWGIVVGQLFENNDDVVVNDSTHKKRARSERDDATSPCVLSERKSSSVHKLMFNDENIQCEEKVSCTKPSQSLTALIINSSKKQKCVGPESVTDGPIQKNLENIFDAVDDSHKASVNALVQPKAPVARRGRGATDSLLSLL